MHGFDVDDRLLPVLNLPAAVKEQVARSHYEVVKVLNESKLAGTRTIRQLADDAAKDTDLTNINVARGHYNGVTLALATPEIGRTPPRSTHRTRARTHHRGCPRLRQLDQPPQVLNQEDRGHLTPKAVFRSHLWHSDKYPPRDFFPRGISS